MALVDRPAPQIYDPNASTTAAAMDYVPSIAIDRFAASALFTVGLLAVVGVILLFRHRRRIGRTVADKSLDAVASAVRAKRSLSASIEQRIKDKS